MVSRVLPSPLALNPDLKGLAKGLRLLQQGTIDQLGRQNSYLGIKRSVTLPY